MTQPLSEAKPRYAMIRFDPAVGAFPAVGVGWGGDDEIDRFRGEGAQNVEAISLNNLGANAHGRRLRIYHRMNMPIRRLTDWAQASGRMRALVFCSFPNCDSKSAQQLRRDDLHSRGEAEGVEDSFAVFPGEAEGADIGEAEAGDGVADDVVMRGFEVAFQHRRLRPIDERVERHLMAEIFPQRRSDGFAGGGHGSIF